MITYNRKDEVNVKILRKAFGNSPPPKYSTFYVPSTELFLDFIKAGLAYGAVLLQQSRKPLKQGRIIELAPDHRIGVPLYWHCWNLDSALLQQQSKEIVDGFSSSASVAVE